MCQGIFLISIQLRGAAKRPFIMHKESKLAINYVFANFSAWFEYIFEYLQQQN